MGFWNFVGLASKKDYDKVSQRLEELTCLMEKLTQQNTIVDSSISLLDERINKTYESTMVKTTDDVTTICESNVKHTTIIMNMMKDMTKTSLTELSSANMELNNKLTYVNDSLISLIANTDVLTKSGNTYFESLNQKLDEILKSISENSKNITSITRTEIQEQIADIALSISRIINTFDEQSKLNDEKLNNLEKLFSKLLEVAKIVWVDNIVDSLKVLNTKY